MYAGTQASFEQAARDLAKLAELDISDQRVRRATIKIGNERVQERDAQTAAFQALPLPQQRLSLKPEQTPQAVCVEMDGGRMQIRAGFLSTGHFELQTATCTRLPDRT